MNQNPVPGWPPGEDGNGNNPALIWNCVDAELNRVALVRQLRIKPGSPMLNDLDDMAASARLLAAPKAIIKPVYITRKNNDSVELDGVRFTSRVLSMNLSGVQRAFVYVVTAGLELDQWAKGFSDILLQYWADRIQQLLLSSALKKNDAALARSFCVVQFVKHEPGQAGKLAN